MEVAAIGKGEIKRKCELLSELLRHGCREKKLRMPGPRLLKRSYVLLVLLSLERDPEANSECWKVPDWTDVLTT